VIARLAMPAGVSWSIQGFVIVLLVALAAAMAWMIVRPAELVEAEVAEAEEAPASTKPVRDRTRNDDTGYDATAGDLR
jgi:lipopolysaccharide export system protein LptC